MQFEYSITSFSAPLYDFNQSFETLAAIHFSNHNHNNPKMGSILPCCRSCCQDDVETNEQSDNLELRQPANQVVMERTSNENNNNGNGADGQCCPPTTRRSSNSNNDDDSDSSSRSNSISTWTHFWRKFTNRVRYQHIQTSDLDSSFGNNNVKDDIFRSRLDKINPLRTASTFDSSSKDVLTIRTEEIVFPGSELQREMAKQMLQSLKEQRQNSSEDLDDDEDECVICMEGFSKENPRMPTLCGCGENKTYFHLPCLYQWTEQSNECPACREEITWEEF